MAKATDKPATYNVNSRLKHDGTEYGQGDTVDLTDTQAKPLLELGVVSVPPAPEKK